jgi:hypothetical protein
MTAIGLWWITLGAAVIVVLVVAGLLRAIVSSARRIRMSLAETWTVGKMIANDTAHVDLLRQMNLTADEMLAGLRLTSGQRRGSTAKEAR